MQTNSQEISRLFSIIAPRYDLVNSIISLGQDKLWRKQLVAFADVSPGAKILDVCSGSAEIAALFAKKNDTLEIFAVDFSREMLKEAKEKITKQKIEKRIKLIDADALSLPFNKDYFDVVSIGFGLRNLIDRARGIKEMARVLKSSGKLFILEFSPPQRGTAGKLYRFYIRNILPFIVFMLGANPDAYRYLSSSIESFISPEDIVGFLESAGFKNIYHKSMSLGVVYLYCAEKS